jgi:hypothetical protein
MECNNTRGSPFWDMAPRTPLKFNRSSGGTVRQNLQRLLATCFHLVSCLVYSSTLKMKTCSSKSLVDFDEIEFFITNSLRTSDLHSIIRIFISLLFPGKLKPGITYYIRNCAQEADSCKHIIFLYVYVIRIYCQ